LELFSGGKNTIGTPDLSEKFMIEITGFLRDKRIKNNIPVIRRYNK